VSERQRAVAFGLLPAFSCSGPGQAGPIKGPRGKSSTAPRSRRGTRRSSPCHSQDTLWCRDMRRRGGRSRSRSRPCRDGTPEVRHFQLGASPSVRVEVWFSPRGAGFSQPGRFCPVKGLPEAERSEPLTGQVRSGSLRARCEERTSPVPASPKRCRVQGRALPGSGAAPRLRLAGQRLAAGSALPKRDARRWAGSGEREARPGKLVTLGHGCHVG